MNDRGYLIVHELPNKIDDAAFVEPEEVASRTVFHRVVRYGRLPMSVVLEKVGKRLHTRGFLTYVTEDERRRQPHVGVTLYDKEKSQAYQGALTERAAKRTNELAFR